MSQPKTFYVAIYDFEAAKNDEITLTTGDFVRVTRKTPGGWWYGHLLFQRQIQQGTRRKTLKTVRF
jgi:hypothetical protein